LSTLKLVEQHSKVVATHSRASGRRVESLSVLTLTRKGKILARRDSRDAGEVRQALYAGFVKPREMAHDAAIYRMYHAEAARILQDGGRVRRILLDFELKKRAYSPLAKARSLAPLDYARKQAQIAEENGLRVVGGHIRFPDLRIEYESSEGVPAQVDLELATEHYRGAHMAAKDQAGFKIYADQASFPRAALDEEHMKDILAF
jgi:hypothetical protein